MGDLPGGLYTTNSFAPNLVFTLPDGWSQSFPDDDDEIALGGPGAGLNITRPAEVIDPESGAPIPAPESLLEWFTGHSRLDTSGPVDVQLDCIESDYLDLAAPTADVELFHYLSGDMRLPAGQPARVYIVPLDGPDLVALIVPPPGGGDFGAVLREAEPIVLSLAIGGAGISASTPLSTEAPASASASQSTAVSAEPTDPDLPPGVTEVFDVAFRPSGIVAAGNAIWAEDHAETNRVYAIDPEDGKILRTIDVTRPCDLAVGFDRIWVADLDADRLLSIDPDTGEVRDDVSGLHGPCGVQVVDDAVWAAVDEGLARVDPESGDVSVEDLGSGAFPGVGMPLWAAMYDFGDLVRVDVKTGAITLTVDHPAGPIEGPPVASGFESLWVGGAPDRLYRLDPNTATVTGQIATAQVTRLLVTADAVWVTSYPQGVVERIDPSSNEIVYRARLGGNINGIAEGFGGIWVTDTAAGLLYRIDPMATGIAP